MEKCPGHKRREELGKKVRRARKNSGGEIDSSKRIWVSLGGGLEEDMNLSDLAERERLTPEWMHVAGGGLRVIPVTEFTLSSLPKPDKGVVDFQTKRRNERVIEGYPMPRSDEVLAKNLVDKFKEFKVKGETDEGTKTKVFKTLKKQHEALQKWRDEKAEIVMKEAIEELLRHLKIPSLVVRKVDYRANQYHHLKELGLSKMPIKDVEIDLLIAYVADNDLHVVLCEVKRPNNEPWENHQRPPTKEIIDKVLKQLDTDIDLVLNLLPDVPGSSLIISTFTCFPDTPRSILEKMFCTACMEMILSKDILKDSSILNEKLMIWTGAKYNDEALENLLKLDTRLVGLHSVLHIGWREMRDVGMLESSRMNFNIKKVEKGNYVLASSQQQKAIAIARRETDARHVTLMGAPGSGKTTVLLGLVREFAKQPGKKLVVVTAVIPEKYANWTWKIMEYLDNATKYIKCDRIFSYWHELLEDHNINSDGYIATIEPTANTAHDGRTITIKNYPAIINDLAIELCKQFPEHQIMLAIDEIMGISHIIKNS